jgi:hypothetical protein
MHRHPFPLLNLILSHHPAHEPGSSSLQRLPAVVSCVESVYIAADGIWFCSSSGLDLLYGIVYSSVYITIYIHVRNSRLLISGKGITHCPSEEVHIGVSL